MFTKCLATFQLLNLKKCEMRMQFSRRATATCDKTCSMLQEISEQTLMMFMDHGLGGSWRIYFLFCFSIRSPCPKLLIVGSLSDFSFPASCSLDFHTAHNSYLYPSSRPLLPLQCSNVGRGLMPLRC